jgi:hypothetical protein
MGLGTTRTSHTSGAHRSCCASRTRLAVDPGAPVAPVVPVSPVAPVAPVVPLAAGIHADAPVAPTAPVVPVALVAPVAPVSLAPPVTPVAPAASDAPVSPVAPVESVSPVTPAAPVEPISATVLLDVVSSDEVVWVFVTIIDNVDIPPDIDVVVDELVCYVVDAGVVVDGIGVGGHVQGEQSVMQMDDAVEQSC